MLVWCTWFFCRSLEEIVDHLSINFERRFNASKHWIVWEDPGNRSNVDRKVGNHSKPNYYRGTKWQKGVSSRNTRYFRDGHWKGEPLWCLSFVNSRFPPNLWVDKMYTLFDIYFFKTLTPSFFVLFCLFNRYTRLWYSLHN